MKQIQKLIELSSRLRLELDYYGIDADELLKELKAREDDSYINAEYLILDHIRQWDGKEDNSALKSVLKAKFAELESSRCIPVPKEPEHLETHQEALERLQLKVGDKVKVLCKAKSDKRGWKEWWSEHMDDCIGKTFKVIHFAGSMGVQLECGYRFPAFVLEKAENEKPLPTTEERIAALEAKVGAIYTQLEILVDALIKLDKPKP